MELKSRRYLKLNLCCHIQKSHIKKPLLQHRRVFRSDFLNILLKSKKLSCSEQKEFLTPGLLPRFKGLSVSLSHSESLAGFVFCDSPEAGLGFDMEGTFRVKSLSRVATAREIAFAPHRGALWSVKEAAFKSFAGNLTLKNIQVKGWQLFENTYRCEFKSPDRKQKGLALVLFFGWQLVCVSRLCF